MSEWLKSQIAIIRFSAQVPPTYAGTGWAHEAHLLVLSCTVLAATARDSYVVMLSTPLDQAWL